MITITVNKVNLKKGLKSTELGKMTRMRSFIKISSLKTVRILRIITRSAIGYLRTSLVRCIKRRIRRQVRFAR